MQKLPQVKRCFNTVGAAKSQWDSADYAQGVWVLLPNSSDYFWKSALYAVKYGIPIIAPSSTLYLSGRGATSVSSHKQYSA